MPDGRVHNATTLLTASYLTITAPLYTQVFGAASLAMIPGCLFGLLVSPDLDVDEGNESYAWMRRAGCIPYAAWAFFWKPYAKAIPHRSWVSHFPIVGTTIRIGYILVPILPILIWAHLLSIFEAWIPITWFVAGLMLADFHHWFLDTVT